MLNLKNKLQALTLGLAASAGTLLIPATAQADHRDRDRDDVEFRVDYRNRGGILPRHEEPRRIWVEPVYRTVCDRVWVEPVYRTECQRVWIEPVYQDVQERVWIPDRWEVQRFQTVENGRRVMRERRVLVERGHFEVRCRKVMVREGCWQEVPRQVLVCAGHWQTIERQELVTPGHWEEVRPVHYRERPNFDFSIFFGK